ncbi:hypothetical protein CHUAL_003908 [Chamberlinius hualienensis]
MAMPKSNAQNLRPEDAKVILKELLSALNDPENVTRLEEAKDVAGNDMLKYMQYVFPVATDIQMEVIKNFGFSRDAKGATQFALLVKSLEKEDAELANLNAKVRSYFIPMISNQMTNMPVDQ